MKILKPHHKKWTFSYIKIHFKPKNHIWLIFKTMHLIKKSMQGGVAESANGVIKSLPSVSGGTILRQETLQVQQEVNPSLYEELKLGQDGAGFKRLKLLSRTTTGEESFSRSSQERQLFEDVPRKETY